MNRRELLKLGTAVAAGLLLHESATAQDAHALAKDATRPAIAKLQLPR